MWLLSSGEELSVVEKYKYLSSTECLPKPKFSIFDLVCKEISQPTGFPDSINMVFLLLSGENFLEKLSGSFTIHP